MSEMRLVQMLSRRGALSLEIKGMTRRGRSAYSIIKDQYNLQGSRQKVLDQLDVLIEEEKAK